MVKSIANTEVVNEQKAFHSRADRLKNIVTERMPSWGGPYFEGWSISNSHSKLTFIQKCRNEISKATSNTEIMEIIPYIHVLS